MEGTKIMAEMRMGKRILIVTNDSTVFQVRNCLTTPFETFGGRVTEVKNLVKRLDTAVDDKGRKLCDVSFGVITTKYGFVPGNYQIMDYPDVMSDKEGYRKAEEERGFVEQTSFLTRPFDKTILCVPNDMFEMFLEHDGIGYGKLIAVTSPRFKEECEKRGWTWLERRGARVGDANADEIERLVRELCSQRAVGILELEEASLQGCSSSVAPDPSGRGNDPVAGHDYGKRVFSACGSRGAESTRMPRFLRQFRIRPRLTVGDAPHGVQNIREELRSAVAQREFELPSPSGKVFVDLTCGLRQRIRLALFHGGKVLGGQVEPDKIPIPVLCDADPTDECEE